MEHPEAEENQQPEKTSTHDKIMDRFKAVVSDVLAREKNADVLFVTHSQGTALTGDFLSTHNQPFIDEKGLNQATLVTMGSPISHIYQYYFFPEFWNRNKPVVGTSMKKWLNLHRDADYIGKEVNVDNVENHNVGKGGHTGYFEDPRVQNILETRGLVPFNDKRTLHLDPPQVATGSSLNNLIPLWLFSGAAALAFLNFVLYAIQSGSDFLAHIGITLIGTLGLGGLAILLDRMARRSEASTDDNKKNNLGFLKNISNLLILGALLGAIAFVYFIFQGNSSVWIAFFATLLSGALALSFWERTDIDDTTFWGQVSHLVRQKLLLERSNSYTCEALVPETFGLTEKQGLKKEAKTGEYDSHEAIKDKKSSERTTVSGNVWMREKTKGGHTLELKKWNFTLHLPEGHAIRANEKIKWAEMMPQKESDIDVKVEPNTDDPKKNHLNVSILFPKEKETIGA